MAALLSLGNNRFISGKGTGTLPILSGGAVCYGTGFAVRKVYNAWISSTWRAKAGDGVMFWGLLGLAFAIQKFTGLESVSHSLFSSCGVLFSPTDAVKFGANAGKDVRQAVKESANAGNLVFDDSAIQAMAAMFTGPVNEQLAQEGVRAGDGKQIFIDPADLVPFVKKGMSSGAIMVLNQ